LNEKNTVVILIGGSVVALITWCPNALARAARGSRLWCAQDCRRSYRLEDHREDFPILREQAHGHPLIYFDSAATSQKPRAVIEALRIFMSMRTRMFHRGLHTLSSRATEAYEKARQRVGDYIGARAEKSSFTRGPRKSINLVAQAWGGNYSRRDVILLTVMEHHSNLVPWQLLAERTGARLRFVPVRDDARSKSNSFFSLLRQR